MSAQNPGSAPGKPAGWRGKKAPAARSWSAPAKGAGWTQRPEEALESARRWHRIQVGIWFLLAAVLIAGFLVYLMYRPMRTPLVMAAATQYALPLPPNAWAREDLQRLTLLERQEVATCLQVSWESKEEGLRRLRDQLDAVRPGGPGKDVVIIYVSVHGAVDGDGQPCLIPPDAATDSRRWLPVRDLLKTLFLEDRPGRIPDRVHKLLVLDAGRIRSAWGAGILYNAFAERLPEMVGHLKVPNLAVLNATGPGQIGWTSADLGGSVFGDFFCQGLQGAADVDQGNNDGQVSLQELQRYLAAQVRQWTLENRADVQTPLLIPADADMQLVYARPSAAPASTTPPPTDPRWDDVARLWLRHSELAREQPYRFRPLAWESFQRKLLRLDELVLAGSASEDEYRQAKTDLVVLADQLASPATPPQLPAFSLALAGRFGRWSTEEADRLQQVRPWSKTEEATTTKPSAKAEPPAEPPASSGAEAGSAPRKDAGEVSPSGASAVAKTPSKKPAAKDADRQPASAIKTGPAKQSKPDRAIAPDASLRHTYYPAAAAAWDGCLKEPTRERFDQVLEFLAGTEGRPKADVAELQFLRILSAQLDWQAAAEQVPTALTARGLADEAGAPADPRVQYLAWELVQRADGARRSADDKLLVGTPAALREADAAWAEAVGAEDGTSGYRAAVRVAERAAAAMALRDRAWSEIPYLAPWALRGSPRSPSQDMDGLREFVLGVQELSEQLERSIRRGALVPEVDAAQTLVENHLAALEKAVAYESYRLRAIAGEDQHTLRAIEDLLAVPLVSGDDRNRLREKYLRIARTRAAARAGGSGRIADTAASPADVARQRLDALLPAREHLAVTILTRSSLDAGAEGAESPGPAPDAASGQAAGQVALAREEQLKLLAAQGETVRQLLDSVRITAGTSAGETQQALEQSDPSPQPAVLARVGLSKADRLVRAAAPLVGRMLWNDPREEPSRQLAELDLRFLLAWQAGRALEDFWGSASDEPPPYFQTVAQEYLAAARDLGPLAGSPTGEEKRLAAQVARLAQAAAQGIQTSSKDLLVDETEPYVVHETQAAIPENTPEGVSAFVLGPTEGSTLPLHPPEELATSTRRLPIPIPATPASQQLAYALRNGPDLSQARGLQTTVLYRGHQWRSEFFAQPAHGLEIVYEPPRYPAPTVAVFGQARQQASVMFILDCSGSMTRRLGGVETQGKLIDLARDTLEAMLLRLVGPDDPYRVGVLVYGHRCGWNPAEGRHNELVVPDPARPGQFTAAPPDFPLHPNSDVQAILPLGVFSDRIRRDLESRLDALPAMGQTPLYLAIIQVIGALRQEPQENRRHVVAITDGFNDQTSGGPPDARKFRKDVEDVLAAVGNRSVQLDIVGFDLIAKTPDEKKSEQDVRELAAKTGGAFHSAADPSTLLKALEKSLGLVQYTVQPVATRPGATPGSSAAEPVELGRTVTVEQPVGVKRDYRVALVDPERPAATDIVLEGGEAIQLYLATDPARRERRLVHRRYERDLRASADAVIDPADSERRFFIGAHLPERVGRAVRFPVSIQNADAEQFSPRPIEAWVQIRPRLPNQSLGLPYSFYDLAFESDRPVPVLSCLAPVWPDNAASAEVRLWFKRSKTEPDRAVSLERFTDQAVALEQAPDVRFSLELGRREKPEDPHVVILVERHPPGSTLDAVKVEIWPPPERTVHRYSFETATVRHTFVYHASAAAQMRDARVLFTSQQRLTEGAVALAEPLEVTIPRGAVPLGR